MTSLNKVLFAIRDVMSRAMFTEIREAAHGDILDVGGWDFFLTVKSKLKDYSSYTVLDLPGVTSIKTDDPRFKSVIGDGCSMHFPTNSFDTVINIQVLEHVFEPIKMFSEICRVLKPGGKAIISVPQTSNIHMAPFHFYNFTRYWIEEASVRNGMNVIKYVPLGGGWLSSASRSFYFLLQALGAKGRVDPRDKRSIGFKIFLPLMILASILQIILGLLLSLFDNVEEAPNHLIVLQKPH